MKPEIHLIGVPFDLGGGRSGARYGPDELIRTGLIQTLAASGISSRYCNIYADGQAGAVFDSVRRARGRVHHAREVVQMAQLVGAHTFAALRSEHLPVVLGGDHSISIGSVGAALHPDMLLGKRLGLVWIDAHFDAHTHLTTHSHRAHGLPLATLLGHGPRKFLECAHAITYDVRGNRRQRVGTALLPSQVVHIGAGEEHCESEEYAFFEQHHISQFSRKYLHKRGWSIPLSRLQALANNVDFLWVSLDLDSLDRSIAPGVYYQNPDGLLREEILKLATVLSRFEKLRGVDIMEYNPRAEETNAYGHGITADTVSEFLLRILGK